ncbi:MAG: glucuronate isomerase [Lachnospiraceae bacterium]|jgi:glucuronate isomerase|nr:glucuronate isomerase [Lachnospiraceae bacterium]
MRAFMDQDFLLETDTAKHLYHSYAKDMPIIDYHCHINPQDIATDKRFENITQLWLGADHYKWKLMRSFGVDEKLITGDATDKEKFFAWAAVLGKAIGNPLYHWSHLELRRFFGYEGTLNSKTAQEVWTLCNAKLQDPSMSAKNLIRRSRVDVVVTTDDPVDSLQWHDDIAKDKDFTCLVLPAFRPDRAMNIEKTDFIAYIQELSGVCGMDTITSFALLKQALKNRIEYFAQKGCIIADHGMDYCAYAPADASVIEQIFAKCLSGVSLSTSEKLQYQTAFLLFCAQEYHSLGWTMQLHYGCKRNNNSRMFNQIGPDTGYDCIGDQARLSELADFLNALDMRECLPKTILYSLDPNDNAALDTIIGCFQSAQTVSKIQHGSAWWFNDHIDGMTQQLRSLAATGNLSGFVGMLTDSRSFLSYTRHEYFRRILCNLIGNWVENGEFSSDEEILEEIIKDISYHNARRYFQFLI